jgi:hypothetical protein
MARRRRFVGGVSHDQHLRLAWVLICRHGTDEAEQHLVAGTRRACEVRGAPEKFDEPLTRRWARALADLIDRDGLGLSAEAFVASHPELGQRDRFTEVRPVARSIRRVRIRHA